LESRQARKQDEEIRSFQKPVFTVPIQNVEKEENQNARFAARLIPVGDASLKVEWFKDGQLLSKGIDVTKNQLWIQIVRTQWKGNETLPIGILFTNLTLKCVKKVQ